MPYGMGRAGWFCWPPGGYWAGWHPEFGPQNWPPFYPASREEEKAMIEEQVKILEGQLDQIKARLNDLKNVEKEKTHEK
jgi:hypothetical protein